MNYDKNLFLKIIWISTKANICVDFKFVNAPKKVTGKKLGELWGVLVQSPFPRFLLITF
jgi:hypothetical protein